MKEFECERLMCRRGRLKKKSVVFCALFAGEEKSFVGSVTADCEVTSGAQGKQSRTVTDEKNSSLYSLSLSLSLFLVSDASSAQLERYLR